MGRGRWEGGEGGASCRTAGIKPRSAALQTDASTTGPMGHRFSGLVVKAALWRAGDTGVVSCCSLAEFVPVTYNGTLVPTKPGSWR